MPVNYDTISTENLARYGWDIERIGKILLADRHADPTHFVFELLQNAEEAIRWRPAASTLPRSVLFDLHSTHLDVSHFGLPFEERHVRSICGIAESTKENELTAIGRFGIGFKSVYAFTNRPEAHSGDEHFAIDAFVRPRPAPPRPTQTGQTLFHLPFTDGQAFSEILQRLRVLGHRTLLFLKHIESIEWKAAGTNGGTSRRDPPSPSLRTSTRSPS